MALLYQSERELVRFQTKTTATSNYRSDQKSALFGGRGGRDEEIDYLSSQSTNPDTKLSDAWQGFGSSQSVGGSRANETRRKFFEEKDFP